MLRNKEKKKLSMADWKVRVLQKQKMLNQKTDMHFILQPFAAYINDDMQKIFSKIIEMLQICDFIKMSLYFIF